MSSIIPLIEQVLTAVLAFWNRVDYRIRQMAPWATLFRESRTPACRGVLVDYISPSKPEIIWRSVQNRDWLVSISSIVGILQTALMVISTGLFSLTPVPTTMNNVAYKTTTKLASDSNGVFSLSQLPSYTYNAIHALNLSYPAGTTPDVVYQEFTSLDPALPVQAIQQVIVDTMASGLDCTPAKLQGNSWTISWLNLGCWSPNYPAAFINSNLNISAFDCQISPSVSYTAGNDGEVGSFAVLESLACNNDAAALNTKVILMVGEGRQSGNVGPKPSTEACDYTNYPEATITITRSKQWICTPNIQINKGIVTFNSSVNGLGNIPDIRTDPHAGTQNISLDGTFYGIVDALYSQGEYTSFQWDPVTSIQSKSIRNTNSPSILEAVLRPASGATVEDFLDSDLFLDLFKKYYKEFFVQVAHAGLILSDDSPINGTATFHEDRLMAREVPLRAMQSILSVLIVFLAICLIILPRQAIVPVDPANLAGLLSILQANTPFANIFVGAGSVTTEDLSKSLEMVSFTSKLGPRCGSDPLRFTLQETTGEDLSKIFAPELTRKTPLITWWRPITICKRLRLFIFTFVVAIVIVLEVLLSLSKKNQGLGNVSIEGNQHLAWSWTSSGIVVVIALYFQSLDSSYRTFIPYCQLKKGSSAQSSIAANYLSSTAFEVIWLAIRDRLPGAAFSAFSAILSIYLTTIVSGVFVPTSIPFNTTTTLSQTSWFLSNGSGDDGSHGNNGIISSLIVEGSLSYPTWTYHDLALSSITLLQDSKESISQEGTILQSMIKAIRPTLNCSIYEESQIPGLIFYPDDRIDPQDTNNIITQGIYMNMPGPAHCAGNASDAVQVARLANGVYNSNERSHPFIGFASGKQEDCPSLNFIWGALAPFDHQIGMSLSVTWARVLSCYETISQVDVQTTFSMPAFSIDEQNPPLVDEESVTPFSSATVHVPYDQMIGDAGQTGTQGDFFYKWVTLKNNITTADYGNPDKVDTIAAAIEEAHKIARAQQYHAVLRTSDMTAAAGLQKRATSDTSTGTLVNPNRYRLVVDAVSTHILSGLLMAMLLFAGLASLLMSTREILPKNPCSIAAMTSLLADSNMLAPGSGSGKSEIHRFPDSPKEQDSFRVIYKMGWFDRGPNEAKAFTIYELKEGMDDRVVESAAENGEAQQQVTGQQCRPNESLKSKSLDFPRAEIPVTLSLTKLKTI
ncbi:hypothetical protein LTR84_006292 [Exophiala bonariae]|uniref:Uncharacterized protein n=1 Tax=Exophiala bonariae TaxID=1690606 RepID=A0AAV9N4N4_9EURO|nr:hypothetical protein LTR84_006292 [Exophiala bonariae]